MIRRIAVVGGSKNDFYKVPECFHALHCAVRDGLAEVVEISACSTHRNPKRLRAKALKYAELRVDAVILMAGKLAAIFGDFDALLRNELFDDHVVVIPVPIKGDTPEDTEAAKRSADSVPGSQFDYKPEYADEPLLAFQHAISGVLRKIELKGKAVENFTLDEIMELIGSAK